MRDISATVGALAIRCILALPILGPLIGIFILRRPPQAPDALVNALRSAVHGLLAVGIIVGGMWVLLIATELTATHKVQGKIPDLFPVLAVVPEQGGARYAGYVIVKEDLEAFKREHPVFSLLVPEAAGAYLHETARYYKVAQNSVDRPVYFKVQRVGVDRQSIEVRYRLHSEARSAGWYEATAQGFEPKRYMFFHDMMLGITFWPALLIGIVVYWLFTKALERRLWSRFPGRSRARTDPDRDPQQP